MAPVFRNSFVFAMLALVLFFTDLYAYFFIGSYLLTGILALYATTVARQFSPVPIIYLLAFSTLESFFFYGYAALQFIITIPALVIAMRLRTAFYNPTVFSSFLILSMLLVQSTIIETYLLNMPFSPAFTISKLCINLILTIMISLKY